MRKYLIVAAPLVSAAIFAGVLGLRTALADLPVAKAEITIDNFSFGPTPLTVARGTTVTWTNRDDIPHTVVNDGDPRQFKSSPLDTDDTYSFTFNAPGKYKFFCSIHPKMQGVVIVQ